MTQLRVTIKETTTTDLLLEAPNDMTLEQLQQAAEDGDILDYCNVLSETPDTDEGQDITIYEFNGKEVEDEKCN